MLFRSKPEILTINQYGQDEEGVYKILNDVTVGEYDVVMDTGPGYNSKRQEAVDAMMQLFAADPALIQTAGDLLVRNMDFPGAETIADRLAVNNPLAQVDDKSKVPPRVQMQLQQLQAQNQQMQQSMQQLQQFIKQRQDIEQVKQDNETKRELMRETTKAHVAEKTLEARVHDVNTKATTSQNKMEIEAIMELLLHHMDTKRLEREIAMRNEEQKASESAATESIKDNSIAR